MQTRTETIAALRGELAEKETAYAEYRDELLRPARELEDIKRALLKNEVMLALEAGSQREIEEALAKSKDLPADDKQEIAERIAELNAEDEDRLYEYRGQASEAIIDAVEFLKASPVQELFERQATAYRAFVETKKRMAHREGRRIDELTAATTWKPIRAGRIDGVTAEALMFLAVGIIAPALDVHFDVLRPNGYKPERRG